MPAYTKTVWVNGTAPALNDTNLNKIEQGIYDALRQDGSTSMSGQLVTIAGTVSVPSIAPTGDANTGIYFPSADTIGITTGGTNRITVSSAGLVGIGTTPNKKLEILNKMDTVSTLNEVLRISNDYSGTGDNEPALKFDNGLGNNGYFISSKVAGGNYFRIIENSSERLRIDSSGNVGVGISAPQAGIHCGIGQILATKTNDGSSELIGTQIGEDADGYANADFRRWTGAGTNHGTGRIVVKDDASMNFLVDSKTTNTYATTNRMIITSAGNVGIGTTSPTVASNVTAVCANGTSGAYFEGFVNGTRTSTLTTTSASVTLRNLTNNPLLFFTNAVERFQVEAAGTLRPSANNTYELGSSSFRWSTIYAQNALNTSDARLKTDVEPSSLGLDFINALNPVQYKYIEGGNTVERVESGTEEVLIQEELKDEEGNVIQEAVYETQPKYEVVTTPVPGVRTHFGLIAQEVKAALPADLDFGGWCLADKNDPNSIQSLGYTQLIAPMIKAIQELNEKVKALETQLASK